MAGAARRLLTLLLVLVLSLASTDAGTLSSLLRPALRAPSNTLKLPVGPVLSLETAATSKAAAAVTRLGEKLTPRWWRETTAQLAEKGVTLRRTERILVNPTLRIIVGSVATPIPHTLKELAEWFSSPATPISRFAFNPLQVSFRTQFYWAEDWQLGLAQPGQTAPNVAGTGTRAGLRRLLGMGSTAGDVAALRAQLLARVTAEVGSCVAQYTLGEAIGNEGRRALLESNNATHDDPLAPLRSLNLTHVAVELLAHMHGSANGTHDWG